MTFTKTLAVGTFLASTLIAGSAFAKGHDQGAGPNGDMPGKPGTAVHDETVSNSPARNQEDGIRAQHDNARDFDGHPSPKK